MDDTEGGGGGGGDGERERRGRDEEEASGYLHAVKRDDAGRVELLAATQVGRPVDCRIVQLISSRTIVLEPNIIFPSQLPSAAPIHSAEAAGAR